jgi:hypothetical protein
VLPYHRKVPGLSAFVAIDSPITSGYGEVNEQEFPSPDGEWALKFSDPWELAMGLSYWGKTQLSHVGKGRSEDRDLAAHLGHGAHAVASYWPWNAASNKIVLPNLVPGRDAGFVIYDVGSAMVRHAEVGIWLRGTAWSPHEELLFLVDNKVVRVTDCDGAVIATAPNDLGWSRAAAVGWTANGMFCFCTGPGSGGKGTALLFFDPRSAERVAEQALDPVQVVPYNVADYEGISRGTYSLVLGPSGRGVGSLLDDWSDILVDRATGRLMLAVFRPTSPAGPFPRLGAGGHEVFGCTVEKRWVSAQLYEGSVP